LGLILIIIDRDASVLLRDFKKYLLLEVCLFLILLRKAWKIFLQALFNPENLSYGLKAIRLFWDFLQ
jgi:hypothetical protein